MLCKSVIPNFCYDKEIIAICDKIKKRWNMNFILNNTHRKYMGLKELKESYDLQIINKGIDKYYVYFDADKIVKLIYYNFFKENIIYHEIDVNYQTCKNRTFVLPKTSRGKERKLNYTTIKSLNGYGNYFFISSRSAVIGNYTTHKYFYEESFKEGKIKSFEDIEKWCDKFIKYSTEKDLEEVTAFAKEKRKHIKYQEGDYFRVKFGRNMYGYGRILMDIRKQRKLGLRYDFVMLVPLIIEMFYILTPNKNVAIEELENLSTFPSQHIGDNRFFYGDYEIIGNRPLPQKIKYPIMYGRSISELNRQTIVFQCGKIYREIDYQDDILISKEGHFLLGKECCFLNNGIGINIDLSEEVLKKCIREKSEKSYWEYKNDEGDLRAPKNKEYLIKVLKQFDLEELLEIYMY